MMSLQNNYLPIMKNVDGPMSGQFKKTEMYLLNINGEK